MCDDQTVEDDRNYPGFSGRFTRRQFQKGVALTALAAMLPPVAFAAEVVERGVRVSTPDGIADGYFVHPGVGKHPGVLIWPDILGLRPAFKTMGKRLAQSGYAVLVMNPFYRDAQAPVVANGASFQDPVVRSRVLALAKTLSPDRQITDARAFVDFLDQQAPVDTQHLLGTMGYCMGGAITMRTAATVPDRVGAGASFHGGGLVTEAADSPHLLVPRMRAEFLFAIAQNDDEREPDTKRLLAEAYHNAGREAEIEVYQHALHGWCVPDSPVYNEAQAERAWNRLLALFARRLSPIPADG